MKRINMHQPFNGSFMRPIESSHIPLAVTTTATGLSSDNPPQSSSSSSSSASPSTSSLSTHPHHTPHNHHNHHHQHQIFSSTTTPSSPPPPPPPPLPQPPSSTSITTTSCFEYRPLHPHPDNVNANTPATVTTITQDELDIPEFKQYDKEKYENAKSGNNRRRRKSTREECDTASSLDGYEEDYVDVNASNGNNSSLSHAEMRRRMHIQSEQKRRAEIKDGFEDLRRQLPISNHSRKMSKAMLLQKTVSHIRNMKTKECYLLEEINRLNQYINYLASELDREKRMNVIHQQKENLDKLYQIGL